MAKERSGLRGDGRQEWRLGQLGEVGKAGVAVRRDGGREWHASGRAYRLWHPDIPEKLHSISELGRVPRLCPVVKLLEHAVRTRVHNLEQISLKREQMRAHDGQRRSGEQS